MVVLLAILPTATHAADTGGGPCGAESARLIDNVVEHQLANLAWSNTPGATREELRIAAEAQLHEHVAFCEQSQLSGAWHAFCDGYVGCGLLREYASFKSGYARCEWEEESHFELRYYVSDNATFYYPPHNQERWSEVKSGLSGGTGWGRFDHGKVRRKCSFGAPRGTWHVERVGPFRFYESDEWHAAWWDPFKAHEYEPPANIGHFIIGSFVSLVMGNGEVLAYPPVHMHHFHLFQGDRVGILQPHTHYVGTETHGDSGCLRSSLSGLCYMQVFPEGYGLPFSENYFCDSNVNFVSGSPSPEGTEFWFQAAIYVPHAGDEAYIHMPTPIKALGNQLMNPLQKPEAGTYRVPNEGEAATWYEEKAMFSGKIAWLHWHAHYFYQQDYWIFVDVPAQELGLNSPPYVLHKTYCGDSPESWPKVYGFDTRPDANHGPVHCRKLDSPMGQSPLIGAILDLTPNGLTIDGMKAQLLVQLAAYRERTGKGTILAKQGDVRAFNENFGSAGWASSKPLITPSTARLEQGMPIVAVAFLAPQAMPFPAHKAAPPPQP